MANLTQNFICMDGIADLDLFTDGQFDFNKIIKPNKDNILDIHEFDDVSSLDEAWRRKHWGVTSNALETSLMLDCMLEFITKWEAPVEAIAELSRQYPDKPITHVFKYEFPDDGVFLHRYVDGKLAVDIGKCFCFKTDEEEDNAWKEANDYYEYLTDFAVRGSETDANNEAQKLYLEYLNAHVLNVYKAYTYLQDKGIVDCDLAILEHDESKFYDEEFRDYAEYFYGSGDVDINHAWLNHIHENPHHWQHWILHNDDGSVEALEMPEKCIVEMICDWWSFGWGSGNLEEIFSFWEKNNQNMILHPKTRERVELILGKIKESL